LLGAKLELIILSISFYTSVFCQKKLVTITPKIGYSVPYYAKSNFDKNYYSLAPKLCLSIDALVHYKVSEKLGLVYGLGLGTFSYRFKTNGFEDKDIIIDINQYYNLRYLKLLVGTEYNIKRNLFYLKLLMSKVGFASLGGGGNTPTSTTEDIFFIDRVNFYNHNVRKNPYFGAQIGITRKITDRKSINISYEYNNFKDGMLDYYVEITKQSGTKSMYGMSRPRIDQIMIGIQYELRKKKLQPRI